MTTPKPIWEIRLLIETDDPSDIDRLSDAVARAACPDDSSEDNHACRVPWFVVRSEPDDGEAWRELLNR